MSKLYKKFLDLKKANNKKIYLFKSGIFYIALAEDAKIISELFNFKITNLNDEVTKCGFPETKLEYYTCLLQQNNIEFEIIDIRYNKIENYSDYLNNIKFKNIINTLEDIDMNNISFRQAFDILEKLSNEVKNVK